MKLSRVIVLAVALVAGLVAAFLALNLTSTAPTETVVTEAAPGGIEVLVAGQDIPMGSRLEEASLEWQVWPAGTASGNFIVRSSDPEAPTRIAGALARSTFYAGEPISEARVIRSDQGFMSALLPAGKRAVATKIAADTSAGGFILPNDRVDVIMTRQAPSLQASGPPQYLTETILSNVRVLAIDQTIEDKGGEQVVVGQTATLELSAQQAEILTVAQSMTDRLTLALRSIADAEPKPGADPGDALHLIGGTKQNGSVTVVKNGIPREVTGIR